MLQLSCSTGRVNDGEFRDLVGLTLTPTLEQYFNHLPMSKVMITSVAMIGNDLTMVMLAQSVSVLVVQS